MSERSPFILLVEDDDDERFLAERVLTRGGFRSIKHFGDGLKAKNYLEELTMKSPAVVSMPDVVLMDLKLPGMHGQEVLEWMDRRPELSSLLRYVLSSSGNPLDRERAQMANVTGYFMKPLTPANIEELKRALEQKSSGAN